MSEYRYQRHGGPCTDEGAVYEVIDPTGRIIAKLSSRRGATRLIELLQEAFDAGRDYEQQQVVKFIKARNVVR